ncbi:MFS transporter [Candidatus Woesearchaeota archaeon]|nr:MFS transporter [Candidatus Woesearchaeota archaeon]
MNLKTEIRHQMHAAAIKRLGSGGVFIALAYAAFETIWALLVYSIFPSKAAVGIVIGGFYLLLLLSLAFLFPLFNKFSARKLLLTALAVNSVVMIFYAVVYYLLQINAATIMQAQTLFFTLAAINAIFMAVRIQSMGILLRMNSLKKEIDSNENFMYMFANVGWILGPLMVGIVSKIFRVDFLILIIVMIAASACLLIATYITAFSQKVLRQEKQKRMQKVNVFKNLRLFFSNKKRIVSYILSSGLEVWWTIPYIFIPIEMITTYGMNVQHVGIFMFLLCIPLILIEFFMRKKITVPLREIMMFGFGFVGTMGFIAVVTNNVYVILGSFIIASFGMGLLEPATESYFFKITNEEESERFYGSFMTSKHVGGTISKFLLAGVLLFAPLKIGIILISIIMIVFAIIAVEHKKKKHKKSSTKRKK